MTATTSPRLAAALATTDKGKQTIPLEAPVTLSDCLKVALKVAAEAARAGTLKLRNT